VDYFINRGKNDMGFLRKIKFWRKRNTNSKVDACVSTEETGICDAATVSTDLTVMCDAYTQVETKTDGGDAVVAAVHVCESELDIKTQKIQELQEELAVSRRVTADLMLNMSSVEQQLRKYAEEPVSSWSDDCECKQQVSAVADLLKKLITNGDINNSKAEGASRRNTKVDGESQTEGNSWQMDRAYADDQETARRLEDKNGKLSVLVKEYERKIVSLKEEREQMLREQTSHSHHIKTWYEEENRRQILKMRDMRDEILWYKERLRAAHTSDEVTSVTESRLPPTQGDTEDHTGRREAGRISNSQQSESQRDHPKERDLGRNRNLPPRLRNRNLPPRLQNRNLPPRLQATFKDSRKPRNENASLKADVPHKERTLIQWTEVTSHRRKIRSHESQSAAKPIPVIINPYEVLNDCDISEYVN
jgi:hypothetical protein